MGNQVLKSKFYTVPLKGYKAPSPVIYTKGNIMQFYTNGNLLFTKTVSRKGTSPSKRLGSWQVNHSERPRFNDRWLIPPALPAFGSSPIMGLHVCKANLRRHPLLTIQSKVSLWEKESAWGLFPGMMYRFHRDFHEDPFPLKI